MKNKKNIIISSVAVILLLCLVLGILYFTTDLFKTNQQLFYKYIAKTEIMDLNFINQYNVVNEKIMRNSGSSASEIKVMTDISNQENAESETKEILKVSSNGLKNTLLKQSYRDFTFSSNNQNFLTLKYLRDDNTYGIIVDNILVKYLAVENANLKEFFSKLGITDTSAIPDSIPTNYEEILKIDQVTLNQLKETYGTLIYTNVNEENFYKISNTDKTQTIGVSLTEKELSEIVKLLLETAKNDNVLLNLIENKAKLLNYTNVTIENMQLEIQNIIDKITNQEYSTDKDFVKLSLVKKDKKVIKIQIETNSKVENNYNDIINNEQNNSGNTEYNKINIELEFSESNKFTLVIKENENLCACINIKYSYNENDINIIYEEINAENEKIREIQYQLSGYQTNSILQKCQINSRALLAENSINGLGDEADNTKVAYKIELNNQIELKQDVQISKLTTENSAKLNDMTQEELSTLFTALINRINTVYNLQNNNLIMQ